MAQSPSFDAEAHTRAEFVRTYSSMRDIAAQESHAILQDFDRTFAEHLVHFDPVQFIKNKGNIPLKDSIQALKTTLKTMASFFEDKADTFVERPEQYAHYFNLSVTFWNAFVSKLLEDLIARTSGPAEPEPHPRSRTTKTQSKPSTAASGTPPAKKKKGDENLKQELLHHLGTRAGLVYPRGCSTVQCSSCSKIFCNLPLSRCKAVHPKSDACTTSGWYPHLSSSSWHGLHKAHDRENFVFSPRPPQPNERHNPLRKEAYKSKAVPLPASSSEPQTSGRADVPPVSPPVGNWGEEVDEQLPLDQLSVSDVDSVEGRSNQNPTKRPHEADEPVFIPKRRVNKFLDA